MAALFYPRQSRLPRRRHRLHRRAASLGVFCRAIGGTIPQRISSAGGAPRVVGVNPLIYFRAGDWFVVLLGGLLTAWLAAAFWQGGAAQKVVIRARGEGF